MEEKLAYSSGWNAATIAMDIEAAMDEVEKATDRALLTQTWTGRGDYFPSVIELPKGQAASVTSLKYIPSGSSSFTTLVEDTDYIVELNEDRARIYPPSGGWPSDVNTDRKGVVEVVWSCGYGATQADVPGWAKSIMMLIAGQLNTNGAIELQKMHLRQLDLNKLYFNYSIND
ncbi:MAG: hypothetical protein ACRBG0_19120 [Lewinella sp.]|uniref:hypothetical protein n=1 Tax=Lewinella sp. TaxID=2004506 RepID=UPI003D6A3297